MADADQQAAVTEWDEQGNPVKPGAATAAPTEWDEKGNPITPKAAAPAMAPGSYQTKPGGPVLNTAKTPPTKNLTEPGAVSRFAGAFNEGLGAPRTLGEAPSTLKEMGKSALLATNPITLPYEAYRQGKRIYGGMKETSDYADQFPASSSAYWLNKGESIVPVIGPAISAAARKGAEDPEGFAHAAPEMLGTAVGTGLGIAGGDPEAREAMAAAPERIGNRLAERRSAKVNSELKEAAPPSRQEINYDAQLERAKPYLAEQQRTQPVKSVREAYEASNTAVGNIEAKLGEVVDAFPQDRIDGTTILQRVREKLSDPQSPRTPQEIERGMKALEGFGLEGELPLKAADRLRWRLNRDNDTEMGMTEADRGDVRASNPVFAAKEALAEELRDGVYDHLEQNRGVEGIRELRSDEGAVMQMRDAFRRNINRAEKSNAPSSFRRLGVFGPVGLGFLGETLASRLGLPPGISAATGLGTAGLYEYMRNRMTPNPTAARAFGRLGRSDLAPNYPEIPPPPTIRGELPAPPVEAGYPAEPQGRVSFQPRQLAGEPPIEAEFIPRRVPTQPERTGIGRMLPERTTPESTIPPDVEEPFRREDVNEPDERTLAGQKGIRQPVRGLIRETSEQAPPREPIGPPIKAATGAKTLGRKGLGGKAPAEAPKPAAKLERLEAGKTPAYVAAAAKEAGAMPAGYQPGEHPGMGFFQFHDPELGGSFYIREGQVSAKAIKDAMEARKSKLEPSPLVEEKTQNVKRELERRQTGAPEAAKSTHEEFSPEQIEDAELAIRGELDMRQSADRPGRYPIIESREGNTNPNWQEITGWRGVGAMKGLEWTNGFTPSQVEMALRRKAGKVYETLIRRAVRSPEEVERATNFNPE